MTRRNSSAGVTEAIRAEAWVVDRNYGPVREPVWRRATHLVWLDYERAVIMTRVISRSFFRGVLRTEMWAGLLSKRLEQADSGHEVNSTAIGGSTN